MTKWLLSLAIAAAAMLHDATAAPADKRCALDMKIDRVYAMHGRYPTVLVTLTHNCKHNFSSVRISCTFLHKGKPLTVRDGTIANVAPGIPASRELVAIAGDGQAFDSARCRISAARSG